MKYIFALLTFILILGCNSNIKKLPKGENNYSFFVGTYTSGKSEGIYKYLLQKNGKLKLIGLAAKSKNPSFITKSSNNKFLLAVNEINNKDGMGTIESFLIAGDSLKLLSQKTSGGIDPCFITVNKNGYVLTANYTSGSVGLHKLNKNGILTDLLNLDQHKGSGSTDRQKGPHAHFAVFESGTDNIISVDLGTNELWFSKLDTVQQKLEPIKPFKLEMNLGSGPRHLAFHPNKKWIYVINELNSTITMVKKMGAGVFEKGASISTMSKDYTKQNAPAEIKISSDGKFVYASNRGNNSIAIFKVNPLSGLLKLIDYQSTLGDGPRYFTLSPDENFLLVANQNTNNIVSFKRNKNTGFLKFVNQVKAPSPVCILF